MQYSWPLNVVTIVINNAEISDVKFPEIYFYVGNFRKFPETLFYVKFPEIIFWSEISGNFRKFSI
jgi:hypothetical protein